MKKLIYDFFQNHTKLPQLSEDIHISVVNFFIARHFWILLVTLVVAIEGHLEIFYIVKLSLQLQYIFQQTLVRQLKILDVQKMHLLGFIAILQIFQASKIALFGNPRPIFFYVVKFCDNVCICIQNLANVMLCRYQMAS